MSNDFLKNIFRRKKKKESRLKSESFKTGKFFEKILPGFETKRSIEIKNFIKRLTFLRIQNIGWRFYQKPGGFELE